MADLDNAQKQLGHFEFYKREDIPEALHYKNNDRIPPILVIPDNGWILKQVS